MLTNHLPAKQLLFTSFFVSRLLKNGGRQKIDYNQFDAKADFNFIYITKKINEVRPSVNVFDPGLHRKLWSRYLTLRGKIRSLHAPGLLGIH